MFYEPVEKNIKKVVSIAQRMCLWPFPQKKDLQREQERNLSKSVIIANDKNEFRAYSTEETMALKINKFKGWRCAAGIESLHICNDGGVQLAACNVMGRQGNIFKDSFELPKQWLACPKEACMCGSDMQIRKVKDLQWKETAEDPTALRFKEVQKVQDPIWVGPYHTPNGKEQFRNISWDMGKRCNYSCSYCPPSVSNKTDPLLTWEQMKTATDKVVELYQFDNKIKWVITGGEPTLIPDYLKWVDYVTDKGHLVHTTTNGSRGGAYLEKLIEKSFVGLSVHLEFLDLERLIQTCERVILKKQSSKKVAQNWFGVRVMVQPNQVGLATEIKKQLLKIPDFSEHAHFFASPVHEYQDSGYGYPTFGKLYSYSDSELSEIHSLI